MHAVAGFGILAVLGAMYQDERFNARVTYGAMYMRGVAEGYADAIRMAKADRDAEAVYWGAEAWRYFEHMEAQNA